jgi:hypothetical protein
MLIFPSLFAEIGPLLLTKKEGGKEKRCESGSLGSKVRHPQGPIFGVIYGIFDLQALVRCRGT